VLVVDVSKNQEHTGEIGRLFLHDEGDYVTGKKPVVTVKKLALLRP
jgi:hypothetical protein